MTRSISAIVCFSSIALLGFSCKRKAVESEIENADVTNRIILAEPSSVEYDTTYNPATNSWTAKMGPKIAQKGGIVCDYAGGELAPGWQTSKFRTDPKQLIWYIAPSDPLMSNLTGEDLDCGKMQGGSEPKCEKLRKYCGMKVKIWVEGGTGTPNIIGKNPKGPGFVDDNAYKKFLSMIKEQVGEVKSVPKYVVAVINDFCPKNHSVNTRNKHCDGNQVDLGPGPYLTLMNSFNSEGWLVSDKVSVKVQLLGHTDDALGPAK